MGIFGKDRELFKPEYNKNQYSIQSNTRQSYSQKEVTLEENISLRCPIDNLQKIWAKNFIMLTMLPLLFIASIGLLEAYIGSEVMLLTVTVLFLIIYAGIWLQNMHMKDKLVNTYVDRKTKFYELLYKRMSEKYTVAAECADKINEYIRIFPKKYKMHTALKEITGIVLFFVLFTAWVFFLIGALTTISVEKYFPYESSFQLLITLIVVFGIVLIIIYKLFIINPLKRKNEIWYEISLFEKNVTDTLQQIIPDNDANKKTVNYPVDKTLKQPFALYFIVSILTGFFFIIWDYQMVMAKQKYLSKAYLVEDYFAELVWSR